MAIIKLSNGVKVGSESSVPHQIDVDNLIANPTNSEYTATEDCYILHDRYAYNHTIKMQIKGSNNTWTNVLYLTVGSEGRGTIGFILQKGSTVKVSDSDGAVAYKVYGLK